MFRSKKTPRSFRSRLAVEQFDARIVPAVVLTQLDLDGDGATDDIRIVGDAHKSTLIVQDDGAGKVHVNLDINSNGKVDPGDIHQDYTFTNNSLVMDISSRVERTPSVMSSRTRLMLYSYILFDMGAGNDVIFFRAAAGRVHVDMTVNAGARKQRGHRLGQGQLLVDEHQTSMGAGNDNYNLVFGDVDFGSV